MAIQDELEVVRAAIRDISYRHTLSADQTHEILFNEDSSSYGTPNSDLDEAYKEGWDDCETSASIDFGTPVSPYETRPTGKR